MKSGIYNLEQIKNKYKRLRIPSLQREYVWKKPELEKLWDDILDLYKNIAESDNAENNQHFMGILTFCFVPGEDLYDVIDGQQRLTTLTVLSDVLSDLIRYSDKNDPSFEHAGLGIDIINIKTDGKDIDVLGDDIHEENDPYIRTYNIFSDLYSASYGNVNPETLLQVIYKRLIFSVNETGDGSCPNDDFENINATGKPLIFADLLLNYLIELEGTDKEGRLLSPDEIRFKWNDMLQSIYKEELPDDDAIEDFEGSDEESDDEPDEESDEGLIESPAEISDDTSNDKSDDESKLNDDEVFKPLKFKKFLNMLSALTDPRSKGMRDSIDEFEDAFRRIKICFPDEDKRDCKNAGYILDTIRKYAGYYTLYLNPGIDNNASYIRHLNYLRCINQSKTAPAIVRALSNKDFSEKDLEDLFHAMTTAFLLKKIYVERDNKKDLNKKLAFADLIYASLPDKSYEKMLYALDDMDRFKDLIKNDEDLLKENDSNLTFWKSSFSASVNKALLLVITDLQSKEPDGYCMPQSDYKVIPLIDITKDTDYKKYGYDENNICELWNMILVKNGESPELTDKNKENRRIVLTEYFRSFKEFCFGGSFNETNKAEDGKRVVPFVCLEYDRYGKYIRFKSPFDENGKLISADRQHYIYSINYIKDEINDIDQNFGTINAEPSFPEFKNETLKYCVGILLNENDEPSYTDTSSDEFALNSYDQDDYDFNPDDDKKNLGLQLFIETAVQMRNIACGDLEQARREVYECICDDIDEHKKSPTSLPFFTKEYHEIYKNNLITDKTNNKWNKIEKIRNYKIKLEDVSLQDDRVIYINNYSGDVVITKGLRRIYSLFSKKLGISFAFFLEMKKGEIHYVGCTRKLTNFRNIGDRKLYERFVLKNDQVTLDEINAFKKIVPECNPYIDQEMIRIFDFENRAFDFESLFIPEYQRGYVWNKDNWNALWNKISEEDNCNLGNIIFYKNKASETNTSGRISIVDGQQRITTILIIICVYLKKEFDYVLDKLISMHRTSKDDFESFSLNEKKNLKKAYDYFKERYHEDQTEKIFRNITSISFNVLTINENAPSSFQYNVFTSINGKGKKLTTGEKIRNYLNKIYPEKAGEIEKIVSSKGFTKAYVEMKRKKHIPESLLYTEFCDLTGSLGSFDELYDAFNVYNFIKSGKGASIGLIPVFKESAKDLNHKELYFWLEIYRHLNVNTADSLILFKLINTVEENDLITLLRRLSLIYFLLYTDDPTGNSRKSINSKLPELAGIDPSDLTGIDPSDLTISISAFNGKDYNLIDDVVLKQGTAFDHAEYLWDKLTGLDLTRSTRRNVSRTILFLTELWNGLSFEEAYDMIRPQKSGISYLYDTDIEHIYPANPLNTLKLPEGFNPPEYLYRLQNVCLLESSINRKVSNGMLLSKGGKKNNKDICFKLGLYADDEKGFEEKINTYAQSRYPIAKAFYVTENDKIISVNRDYILDDKESCQGLYGKDQAEKRMNDLKMSIIGTDDHKEDSLFLKMIDEVLPKKK